MDTNDSRSTASSAPPDSPDSPGAGSSVDPRATASDRGSASPSPSDDPAERGWLVLAHLSQFVTFVGVPGFVGPLAVWLIKGGDDPVVARDAKEALSFSLSLLIYVAALVVLVAAGVIDVALFGGGLSVLALAGLGWLVLAIVSLILPVIAAVRTTRDHGYRYPLTIRFFR